MSKPIVIKITGDAQEINDTITRVGRKLEDFGTTADGISERSSGAFRRISESAAGFLSANLIEGGLGQVTDFVNGSVEAATSLGESINAVNKIFGENSKQVLDWGKQNATSFGLSQAAFNQLSTPLGALLKNSGMAMQDVGTNTIELTKRAADLASVFNVDVSTAMEAINSGLKGEADPLEQFGIGLSAAKVEAQALADTGKTVASTLTDQEKMQARLNLIMKESASVAGDFTQTSGEYANAQRIAAARTEEMQAQIGQKLIPVFQKVTQVKLALVNAIVTHVVPALENVAGFIRNEVVPRFQVFGQYLAEHKEILIGVGVAIATGLVVAFYSWATSAAAAAAATIAATWPVIAIGAAIAALVAGVIYAYGHWGWFRTAVDTVANVLKNNVWPAIQVVALWLSDHVPPAISRVISFFGSLWEKGVAVFGGVRDAVGWVIDKAGALVETVRSLPGKFGEALAGVSSAITSPFRSAFNGVANLWNSTVGAMSFTIPSWIPAIGGKSWNVPDIPTFAAGGWATGLIQVGERGPETLMVPPNTYVVPAHAQRNSGPINVYAQTNADPWLIGREIDWAMRTAGR